MSTYRDYTTGLWAMDWADFTHKRLCWLYGLDRAWAIHKGNDPATNADLARWNRLGRRDAA